MNRVMTARYAGTCGSCSGPVAIGEQINYGGKGRVSHEGCAPVSAAAAAPRRSRSRRYTSDYTTYGGRCEDAPCCGCGGQCGTPIGGF
jgi:hypothetical protein